MFHSLYRMRSHKGWRRILPPKEIDTKYGDEQQHDSNKRRKKPERDQSEKARMNDPLFHALKMQASLTPISYVDRQKLKQKLDAIESFEQLDLLPEVTTALYNNVLEGLTEITPTPVQKAAIPALLHEKRGQFEKRKKRDTEDAAPKFDQFLLAAETGSGKTLAYLLPVVDAVKRQERIEQAAEEETKARKKDENARSEKENVFFAEAPQLSTPETSNVGRPRAIILVPSAELVVQVSKVVKLLSHTVKLRAGGVSSATSPTVIKKSSLPPRWNRHHNLHTSPHPIHRSNRPQHPLPGYPPSN